MNPFKAANKRLLKEIQLFLWKNYPSAIDLPFYYFPCDLRSPEEVRDTINAICDLPVFPWPEDECVVVAEDARISIADHFVPNLQPDATMDVYIVRPGAITTFQARLRPRPIETPQGILPTLLFCNGFNNVRIAKAAYDSARAHRDAESRSPKLKGFIPFDASHNSRELLRLVRRARLADQLLAPFKEVLNKYEGRDLPPAIAADIEAKIGHPEILSMNEHWALVQAVGNSLLWAFDSDCPETWHMTIDGESHFRPSLCTAVGNAAAPCHYKVKSTFPSGFGTKPQKRYFKCKPIFSFVKYDRLYQMATGCGEHEVPPHFRRRHVRHHWLKAGLDRFLLPPKPSERLRLARERNVRTSVVSPCWVGSRRWFDTDMEMEVLE